MTDATTQAPGQPAIVRFLKAHMRDYALLLSLLAIMIFFQFTTDGTLFKPVNMTNLILQNSYIVIMALGMLLIIVAGHIDLSVGSVSGFIGAVAAVMMVTWKIDPFLAGHRLPCPRRGHRRRAGLFRRLLQDTGLHRDAGRHAGLQGPGADRAGRRLGRALPQGLPAAELRLRARHLQFHAERPALQPAGAASSAWW